MMFCKPNEDFDILRISWVQNVVTLLSLKIQATSYLEMLDFNHFSGIEEQVETELEFAPNIWQLKFSLFPNVGNPNGT
jgi:hypothetical protein